MANNAKAYERETITITFQFKDRNGNVLVPDDIDLLIVTIHYADAAGVRRFVRSSDDVLTDPGFTVSDAGLVTWEVQSFETRFDGEAESDDLGDTLEKTVTFELVYYSPQAGTLTDPFATTAESREVLVTHANHGLAVGNDISFLPGANVGGLDLAGRSLVETVPDANHYTVQALAAASSTANGGGDTQWFHGGRYRPDVATLEITRIDPVG